MSLVTRPVLASAPLLLTLALGLAACRTTSSKLPLEQLRDEEQAAENQGEARERVEPLPVEAPTDLLPAEVSLLAEAIDPEAILGLLAPLDEFAQFHTMRGELRSQIGVDLLDGAQWQQVGLDVHGPIGVGLLDVEARGFIGYASLSDQPAFERFIERLADLSGQRDNLASAEVGLAHVYRFGDALSLVLREGVACVVLIERPERAPRDYAATIATIDPREALSRTESFSWAREQLASADDGLIFVNPGELREQIQRETHDERSDWGVRYAQEELDRARASGQSAATLRELEQRVEEERRWEQERAAREVHERELTRSLFGPIGAAVFAAELRADGIDGHGRVLIPGASLLGDLFAPADAESPLLRALDEPPLMAIDGRANMQVLVELVSLLAKADGEELASINAKIRSELGVDVLGELIPALTGAGGLILTQARQPDPKRLSEVPNSLGLAAYVQLAKPDVMRRVLDAASASGVMGGLLTRAKRGDAWIVSPPEWREVQLSIVGDRLIVSTDTKLAARIRDARPGAQAEQLADPNHPLRGPSPTPSLRMYQRWTWLALIEAHEPWEQDADSMLYELDAHATLSPEQAAQVPRSRDFKRKHKELGKVVDELNAYQRRQATQEFERALGFMADLGDAGLQIDRLSDGLDVHAQWRMASTSSPLAVPLRWFMMGDDMGRDWAEYEDIQSRISVLREELVQIRQADLDAAAAKL
ncbi:hypothetical protein [Enhygromyxa salina]|uniref:Uncharacterized protein n=1 Tax=Enhygromyxa salina TaxID=215803 RepID=A0A2S9XC00_9BACT|nr:hypothetical protein [Enhygromyxa salina]PRP90382.1 hypothetical protein ENSA7_82670 [Enhygromyxa salina]